MKLLLYTLVPCPQLVTALFWDSCCSEPEQDGSVTPIGRRRPRGENDRNVRHTSAAASGDSLQSGHMLPPIHDGDSNSSLGPISVAVAGDSAQSGHADQQKISSSVHLKCLEIGEDFELDVARDGNLREAIRTHLGLGNDTEIEILFGGDEVTGSPFDAGMEDGAVVRVNITYPEFRWPDGRHYVGERKVGPENDGFGQRHGRGTFTWPNGDQYQGQWLNDQPDGQGIHSYSDGRRYEGQWRRGEKHGRGIATWPDGQRYEGEMKNGERHGQGVYSWPDGHHYKGAFRNNLMHGLGTYTWNDGRTYAGEFQNDRGLGVGTLTDPNTGESYTGGVRYYQKHGHGRWTDRFGNRYVGEWKQNKKHGRGTWTAADGETYDGPWMEDKRHGRVIAFDPESGPYWQSWDHGHLLSDDEKPVIAELAAGA